MKTIYTEVGKFQFPVRTISLLEKAAESVYHFSRKFDEPLLVMQVPEYMYVRYGGNPVCLIFTIGQTNKRKPMIVGLNYQEGSLIDHKNLLDLPDVYFSRGFVFELIDPHKKDGSAVSPDIIKKAHWKTAAESVEKAARELIIKPGSKIHTEIDESYKLDLKFGELLGFKKETEQNIDERKSEFAKSNEHYQRVIKASRHYLRTGENLEQLIETLKSKALEETTQSP